MKALKSGNAQTTLSRRQQEQQAKIKKIAVAILIAILIFLALLMLESNLIQDEVYTYVLTAQTDIQAGTVVTEQNVDQLFQATAISSRSSDEYNKITLDPQIPNFNSADEAMNQIKKVITSSSYTSKPLVKMQYVNAEEDLTTYAQYIESSTTTTYYADGIGDTNTYHTVKVIDPVDVAFNGGDAVRSSAGEIREGDIVEIGYTQRNAIGETEYVNGWSKDYDEPVLITHVYNDEFQRKEGYYTVYKFGVISVAGAQVGDTHIEDKTLQRATIFVSDATDTGAVLKQVVAPYNVDAAKQPSVMAYEQYFDNEASGNYILVYTDENRKNTNWVKYDPNVDYSGIQVSPAEYDVNKHFMDMSAVHFSAVLTGPGNTIGENVEDSATVIPQVYKVIISKADIQYFYKYIGNGGLIMTKIMNAETDPHLVQPDRDAISSDVLSKYVVIDSYEIIHGEKIPEQIVVTEEPVDDLQGQTLDDINNQIDAEQAAEQDDEQEQVTDETTEEQAAA